MAVELDNYIKKIFSVSEWETGIERNDYVGNISNIICYSHREEEQERPDGYFIDNNIGYVIEHFEFDSSEPIAGSLNRKELDLY